MLIEFCENAKSPIVFGIKENLKSKHKKIWDVGASALVHACDLCVSFVCVLLVCVYDLCVWCECGAYDMLKFKNLDVD